MPRPKVEPKLERPVDRDKINRELEKAVEEGNKRYVQRLRAILMKADGKESDEIARELGVSIKTVKRWIKLWNEKGLKGFKPKKPGGRKPKLSKEQWEVVRNAVDNKSPRDFGYNTDLWSTRIIWMFIRDMFGVEYELRYMYQLLKKKGGNLGSHIRRKRGKIPKK